MRKPMYKKLQDDKDYCLAKIAKLKIKNGRIASYHRDKIAYIDELLDFIGKKHVKKN